MNRRQQQERVRQQQRLVDEAREAQRRPGSNIPPVTDAQIAAHNHRTREAIAKLLDSAQITDPGERLVCQEIIASHRAYRAGGNPVQTALWAEDAITRFFESRALMLLRELDALEHVRIMHNVLREAVAGKPAPFLALLPKREHLEGGAAPLSTADYHRVCIAAGVEGLTRQGGFTQKIAKGMVCDEFRKNGIPVTPGSALEFFKRIRRRGANADEREVFNKLTADAPGPRPEREAWLKRLAEAAGRILET